MPASLADIRDALNAKLAVLGNGQSVQANIANIRDTIVTVIGGPSMANLNSLNIWVAAWQPYSPPPQDTGGNGN